MIGWRIDFRSKWRPGPSRASPAASLLPTKRFDGDPADLLLVHVVVAAPPALELEEAPRFVVDVRVEVVPLVPQRVRRVEVLEVAHEVRAVERAGAEVARHQREPVAAGEAAQVAHRAVAVVARPVGHRRAVDHQRSRDVGARGREHHHRPAALAVADHRGLRALRMALDDDADELRFRVGHVRERLARLRIGEEDHEVDRVAGLQRHADLGVLLEAADARAVAGARIDDHERTLGVDDGDALRRHDADERVVRGPLVDARIRDHFPAVGEHRRLAGRLVLEPLVAALSHRVPGQHAALDHVDLPGEPLAAELERRERAGGPGGGLGGRAAGALDVALRGGFHAPLHQVAHGAGDADRTIDGTVEVSHGSEPSRDRARDLRGSRARGGAARCCAAAKATLPQRMRPSGDPGGSARERRPGRGTPRRRLQRTGVRARARR